MKLCTLKLLHFICLMSIFLDALAVKAIVPDKVQHDVSINLFTSKTDRSSLVFT